MGVFYGLDYRTTGAHMIRAAMEGAALALRHNLHVAQQAGAQVMALHAVGRGAQPNLGANQGRYSGDPHACDARR